jgi:hypothetical protein
MILLALEDEHGGRKELVIPEESEGSQALCDLSQLDEEYWQMPFPESMQKSFTKKLMISMTGLVLLWNIFSIISYLQCKAP